MTIRHVRAVVGFRVHATSEGLEGQTLCGRRPKPGPLQRAAWLPADGQTLDCPRCLERYPMPEAPDEKPAPPETAPAGAAAREVAPRRLGAIARIARKYLKFLDP